MATSEYVMIFCKIVGSLALLIYGMKIMSEALQKMAGSQLRHILAAMTTNRFTGMHRYLCHLRRTIILGNDSDDRELRQCRSTNFGASHLRNHGSEHRYDAHRLDHVLRLQH